MPSTEAEFTAVGVPFNERIGRLEETINICRALWADRDDDGVGVSFVGRYWAFDEVSLSPRPFRRHGPPLWLAGGGQKAFARVGRLFDGWLPYSPTPEQFAAGLATIRDAARSAGRGDEAVTPGFYATINLQEDTARAQHELEDYADSYYGVPLEAMRQLQAFYAGTARGCADWLRAYVEAGASHIVLRFGTLDDAGSMMREAAESLLPELHGAQAGVSE
jgi:alkanesulfonate monooxygenase SsuD/methylene tetrahydromethanopterin reductase-like flavin-dependent oxidoreductase (luciferase family)